MCKSCLNRTPLLLDSNSEGPNQTYKDRLSQSISSFNPQNTGSNRPTYHTTDNRTFCPRWDPGTGHTYLEECDGGITRDRNAVPD